MACLEQLVDDMPGDEAGCACDKNLRHTVLLILRNNKRNVFCSQEETGAVKKVAGSVQNCPEVAESVPLLAGNWFALAPVLRAQTGFGGRAGLRRLSLCSRQVM
jgi:hypothetical protein